MDKLITAIPFEGFYETISSDKIDDMAGLSDYYYESWQDENPQGEKETDEEYENRKEKYFDELYDETDFSELRMAYVKEYAKRFAEDNEIVMEFESLDSPRFYNFTTDRIFCYIEKSEVLRLYNSLDQNKLDELISKKFTSRDGFSSFYVPDQHQWGAVETWDHNQLETIIECFTADHIKEKNDRYHYTAGLMEDFYC